MRNLKPGEIREATIDVGIKKSVRPAWLTLLLGFLAGCYISFAGFASIIISQDVSQFLGYGMSKMMAGVIFSLALILILLAGAELFTGNNLLIMACQKKKISVGAMLKNWSLVYLSNFIGAVFVAFLIAKSGLWATNHGFAANVALKVAKAKVSMPFMQALIRGLLANWLVCLAVWVATSAKTVWGKIIACVSIITPFVACGFEHSIANMFYIPAGIMLKGTSYIANIAQFGDLGSLNWGSMITSNLLPVTIGNIIGGAFFVGALYCFAYNKQTKNR
ncbi:formate/nitrite transporter family protein [Clostridium sp. 'deep sea']|uniref:formate/nitrite transporter family protein n=1 Tax=Clostridium sp. 'deep sea' TaxID=2779445 RepID=UPI0018969DCB|nr:formate/nitrite transporter family protein [Clostridium sp. 'deep sea']QOR34691.1 formate/nitrite transporter family protein [Clostridium sp. 'deep sea']